MKDFPHPNIVTMFDSFLVADELWLILEYMDGGSLTDIVTHTKYADISYHVYFQVISIDNYCDQNDCLRFDYTF